MSISPSVFPLLLAIPTALARRCRASRVGEADVEQPVDVAAVIEGLKRDPRLEECFAKRTGVSEGYSVEEHTRMVMETAEQYRSTYKGSVERTVSWDDFQLFLALHDIGKGIALENQDPAFTNPIAFKEAELATTCKIMIPALRARGVPEAAIELFTQLLRYDAIGQYLKGDIPLEEARDQLLEISHRCRMEPVQVLAIFDAFHAYDSASYPSLFQSIYRVEHGELRRVPALSEMMGLLQSEISAPQQGARVFERLLRQMEEGTLRSVSEPDLKLLKAYIHSTHIQLLNSNTEELGQRKEIFRTLKRGLRDLLLYFADPADSERNRVGQMLSRLAGGHWTEVNSLEDEIIEFRSSYLTRYSLSKMSEPGQEADPSLPLLGLKWIHGANSGLLPSLMETRCLIPSGRLAKLGIVPLSGELKAGAGLEGINKNKLSGTTLTDAGRAASYGIRFQTNLDAEIKLLEQTIPSMARMKFERATDGDCLGEVFTRVSFAIRRLRVLDPQKYEQMKGRIQHAAVKAAQAFELFKTTKCYCDHMPKKLDPSRFTYHDAHWLWYFNRYENGIKQIFSAINDPVRRIPGSEEFLKDPFPIIFGSMSRTTTMTDRHRSQDTERNVLGTMVLGKDIQVVFVPLEKVDLVQKLFTDRGIRVDVRDLNTLQKAVDLHNKQTPYLEDAASKKKLQERRGMAFRRANQSVWAGFYRS